MARFTVNTVLYIVITETIVEHIFFKYHGSDTT